MKFLIAVVGLILALSIFVTPLNILAKENEEASAAAEVVDVYAVFWPVVPGKTVSDPMFFLKQLKETLGGMFSFGNVNKSQYQIGLAEKRLVEANKLFEDKDYINGLKSLDLNEEARAQAVALKKKAIEEKADVIELTNKLVNSLEKQQKALAYMVTQLPEDQKAKLEEILKNLPLQISEAK